MEKKEFPNLPKKEPRRMPLEAGAKSKIAGLSTKTFGVIKFILGVCLLSFVYSSTVSFLRQFSLVDSASQLYFWSGIITFVLIYFFVFEPAIIYSKGHRLLEIVFSFFSPLVKLAPYVLPIYTIIIFILYSLLSLFFKSRELFYTFIFLFSFSLALHLVFSAKTVRSKKGDFLKANYIFGFSFVYIINILLLSLCLNLIFKEFSFVDFFNSSYLAAKNIFFAVFRQLFLR